LKICGVQRFTDLKVWQRAHALTMRVYRLTSCFPTGERFGLTSQIRRAAVSVGANVAEGSKRRSRADYARFLNMAEGSLAEVEHLTLVSRDLGLVSHDDAGQLLAEIDETARMLNGLRSKVEAVE
jgi:four helix bundle protein